MRADISNYSSSQYGSDNLYGSAHENEDIGRYGEYLAHSTEPKDHLINSTNSENLFHDSNSENGKWLKLARKYLAKGSRS